MRLRIQHPLFAGFVGIVALLVVLIVVFVGQGLRRELERSFEGDLERLLALAAATVQESPQADPHDLVRSLTDGTGYRFTLIATGGRVISDSSIDPARVPQTPSLGDRPEVRAALASDGVAFATGPDELGEENLLFGARSAVFSGEPVILRITAPSTEIERTVSAFRTTVAVTGVLAMLLSLIAAYALSVAFARPLVDLSDRARRLAEGDFSGAVPHTRVAELADLSSAFNRLTEELRDRLEDLGRERDGMEALIDCMAEGVVALTQDARVQRMNRAARALLDVPDPPPMAPVGAIIRHPELREALRESMTLPEQSREITLRGKHFLLASRTLDHGGAVTTLLDISELRRMERVRSDFVANASHELKTPLTSIRGYAEALADEPPEHMRRQFLGSILTNTLRLQRLVDDLLDLSRLESGGWKASLETVLVGDVVDEAWALVTAHTSPTVDFQTRGEASVIADRQGLVQVFRNLFENAVRHTPADGEIVVTVEREADGSVQIAVRDDGEGIPAQALPRIFERFYRADSSRARHVGGTGLGLAIVKHMIGAMKGEVWAESELGRGTTVRIRLGGAPL